MKFKKKKKIQTLNRKKHVSLHSILSSPYCVFVSLFKEQYPTVEDQWVFAFLEYCCLFLLSGPSTHRCDKQAHSSLDQESLQCKKQIFVRFSLFFLYAWGFVSFFLSSLWTKCTKTEKNQYKKKIKKVQVYFLLKAVPDYPDQNNFSFNGHWTWNFEL